MKIPDVGQVEMDAELACAGVVVLSDNWFPGWQATIDGKAAEVFPANAAMQGISVPGGRHRIAVTYRPAGIYWGAIVSLAVFLGLGVMVLGRR